jgi:16S rRNA (cytidine1402-2'-O)-methyltransferase
MTFRALEILREVDVLLCEDTRTTGILLKHYKIENKKLESYNAVNGKTKNENILKMLLEGKNIALVSDAGTPGISDPGYALTHFIRIYNQGILAKEDQIQIVPIGGISALTTFVSACGHGTNRWTFYGFLPHKKGRETMLKEMLASEYSSVFYESTHRLEKCLEQISKTENKNIAADAAARAPQGANLKKVKNKKIERKIIIGKELSKIYEEFLIGTATELLYIFKENKDKLRGEFVVMIV